MIQVSLFLYNPKDLDPSYKVDLDFLDYFGKEKNSGLKLEKYYNIMLPKMLHNQKFHSSFSLTIYDICLVILCPFQHSISHMRTIGGG